jgi:hypothetical protein
VTVQNQQVNDALAAHRDNLKTYPNVVDVGVGYKTTKGVMTSQLALIVFVRKKVPAATLATGLIPLALGLVPTDVIELGDVTILTTDVATHRGKHRPVVGGISCGSKFASVAGAGTIGLPLVYRNDVAGLLSNKHVLSPTWMTTREPTFVWKGAPVRQPAPLDGGALGDEVAEAQDLLPIMAGQENDVDADFASYLPGLERQAEILNLGVYTARGDAQPGMEVAKSGRTSGATLSRRVISIGITIPIAYPGLGEVMFRNQIVTQPMLSPGDSGSVLLAGQTVVGLGFAGSDTVSIANPIKTVFDRLGLSLPRFEPPVNQPVPVAIGFLSLLSQGVLRAVWGYDAATQRFLLFDPGSTLLSDLTMLEPGKGYWLALTRDVELQYQGRRTQLRQGWNLVGWLG